MTDDAELVKRLRDPGIIVTREEAADALESQSRALAEAIARAERAEAAGDLLERNMKAQGEMWKARVTAERDTAYAKGIEDAARICDGWIAQFGHCEPKYVPAGDWAFDAVKDIRDGIRTLLPTSHDPSERKS